MSRISNFKIQATGFKAPNFKNQITNKFQYSISNDQNSGDQGLVTLIFPELEGLFFKIVYRFGILYFGHCDLFVICHLLFVISFFKCCPF